MTARNALIAILLSGLLVSAAAGAVIVAYWPKHGWVAAFAHAPVLWRAYLIYWLAAPVGSLVQLLVWLAVKVFWHGKATPAQARWAHGTLIVAALFVLFVQATHIGGLVLSRTQHAAYIAAGGDPHKFHFDPNFIILRMCMAAGALVLIWFANRTPKLLARLSSATPRLGGWLLMATGITGLVCAFLQPFQKAALIFSAVYVGGALIWVLVVCIYSLVGSRTDAAPRS